MKNSATPRRALSAIKIDLEVQQRAIHLDEATVQEYAERIEAGDVFPPATVFECDGK